MIADLGFALRFASDPLDALSSLATRAGTDSIQLRLPLRRLHIVRDAALARKLLISHDSDIAKLPARGSAIEHSLTRDPLQRRLLRFPDDGQFWSREREAVTASFTPAWLARYSAAAAQDAELAADAWLAAGRIDDIASAVARLVFDTFLRNLRGVPTPPNAFDRVSPQFAILSRWVVGRAIQPLSPPAWWPSAANREVRAALRDLAGVLDGLALAADNAPPLWEKMRLADDVHRSFQLASLIIAGYETTASALAWTMVLLAGDPDRQSLIAEQAGHAPQGGIGARAFPLASAAIAEAMHFYPPLWTLGVRGVLRDFMIDGERFAQGDRVLIAPWLVHRLVLRPDAALAFGAGATACIGRGYAQATMAAALSVLLRRIRFTGLACAPEDLARRAVITLQLGTPVALTLAPR